MTPPRPFAAALLPLAAMAAGCRPPMHDYIYVSPDKAVTLVVAAEGGRQPAKGRMNTVTLVVPAAPKAHDGVERPGYDRIIRLGGFVGPWNPAAIAWISGSTINICPLEGQRTVPGDVSFQVDPATRRTIRVTTDCPPGLGARTAARGRG
jgi:hypothetical protein